jgi:2-oxoglutarate dehydrogenase E2 component (dihydrolipoamide succinyltransferase)
MARVDVIMPQMGESIAEGTITKWLKGVGEAVEHDESILEISTDKVDADIPAPASGTLVEILAEESVTVEVGAVIARIETEGKSRSKNRGLTNRGPRLPPLAMWKPSPRSRR